MKASFWGLIVYVAFLMFSPAEIYPFLAPLRLALVVPIITLLLLFSEGKFRIPKTSETFLFILFFIFCLISFLLSPYNSRITEATITHIYKALALFFMTTMILNEEKAIKRFILITLLFILIDNLVSFYAYRKGLLIAPSGKRAYRFGSYFTGGTGSDVNEYGLHMLMFLPFSILLLKNESSTLRKAFLSFSFLSIFYCFTRTLSRGAMIGAAIVMLQLFALNRKSLKYLFLMVVFIAFIFYKTPTSFFERFDTITSNEEAADGSIVARLIAFEDGMALLKKNYLFGIGVGAFRDARATLGKLERVDTVHVAHNTYLEILVETGVFNFFIYMLIIFTVLKGSIVSEKFFGEKGYPYIKSLSQALRIGFTGFLISSFFISMQYDRFFYIFCSILTSIKILREKIAETEI